MVYIFDYIPPVIGGVSLVALFSVIIELLRSATEPRWYPTWWFGRDFWWCNIRVFGWVPGNPVFIGCPDPCGTSRYFDPKTLSSDVFCSRTKNEWVSDGFLRGHIIKRSLLGVLDRELNMVSKHVVVSMRWLDVQFWFLDWWCHKWTWVSLLDIPCSEGFD